MCHGDLHTGNARFDKDGRLTLFDFDSCGYGWRAIDIGVYHVSYDWIDLSDRTRLEKDRFWEAFVDGYDAGAPSQPRMSCSSPIVFASSSLGTHGTHDAVLVASDWNRLDQ